MSAYLCDPYHIGRLAALWAHNASEGFTTYHLNRWNAPLRSIDPEDEAPPILPPASRAAVVLARANVESVQTRYPDTVADLSRAPGPAGLTTPTDYYLACSAHARSPFSVTAAEPVALLKACDCYAYQSCEFDGWPTSPAAQLLSMIRSDAGRLLPGYDDANGWPLRPKADHAERRAPHKMLR